MIGGLLLVGCSDSTEVERPNSGNQSTGVPVRTQMVEGRELTEALVAFGTLVGGESAVIRPQVNGLVRQLPFPEGKEVKRGELLAQIENEDIEAELEAKRYELLLAESRLKRREDLFEQRFVSEDDYEEALNSRNALRARVRVLEATLRKTRILAPFDGVTGLREVSVGAYVDPSTPITIIEQLDPLRVDFSVAERYRGNIRAGDPFSITVAGFPEAFHGRVQAVSPKIEPGSRTVTLRGLIDNPEGKLSPGAFAKVKISLRRDESAILIPPEAIIRSGLEAFVFVVDEEGKAERRVVRTGLRKSDAVEITEGLRDGEELVVAGIQSLRDGMGVRRMED